MGFVVLDVFPVLGWANRRRPTVRRCDLWSSIFGQLFDSALVFDAIGFHEEIEGRVGFLPGLSHPDVLQIGLGLFSQGPGHRAGDVGGLVNPASLFARLGEDIAQRRPEPERTVANG